MGFFRTSLLLFTFPDLWRPCARCVALLGCSRSIYLIYNTFMQYCKQDVPNDIYGREPGRRRRVAKHIPAGPLEKTVRSRAVGPLKFLKRQQNREISIQLF